MLAGRLFAAHASILVFNPKMRLRITCELHTPQSPSCVVVCFAQDGAAKCVAAAAVQIELPGLHEQQWAMKTTWLYFVFVQHPCAHPNHNVCSFMPLLAD
jgi:hypothetical protein